jgi:hypothetical protein
MHKEMILITPFAQCINVFMLIGNEYILKAILAYRSMNLFLQIPCLGIAGSSKIAESNDMFMLMHAGMNFRI